MLPDASNQRKPATATMKDYQIFPFCPFLLPPQKAKVMSPFLLPLALHTKVVLVRTDRIVPLVQEEPSEQFCVCVLQRQCWFLHDSVPFLWPFCTTIPVKQGNKCAGYQISSEGFRYFKGGICEAKRNEKFNFWPWSYDLELLVRNSNNAAKRLIIFNR